MIYIAGAGRSGSTLLARVLGELKGAVNIGEGIGYIFNNDMQAKNLPCGCGQEVYNCSFWSNILCSANTNSVKFGTFVSKLHSLLYVFLRKKKYKSELSSFQKSVEDFLREIQEVTGCDIIIDSSKKPSLIKWFEENEYLQIYIIHLIRDSRGFCSSRLKAKNYLAKIPIWKSILIWSFYNIAASSLKKNFNYKRIKYEEFTKKPQFFINDISSFVGLNDVETLFTNENKIRFRIQHNLAGNPEKMESNSVSILFRKWELSTFLKLVVSFFTFFQLKTYKYKISS